MLQITIPSVELWDESNEVFIKTKPCSLCLEHSLVSISKWEAKWHIPFLDDKCKKTLEQTLDYIRLMTVTQNVNPDVYNFLSNDNIKAIEEYIENPMSATVFYDTGPTRGGGKDVVTSELIYYWMVSYNIPMECQKWHLNRLLTLIRICNIKNAPPKKRSQTEIVSRYAALNKARRQALNSKG